MNEFFRNVLLFTLIPLGIFLLMCVTGDEGILMAGILAMVLVGAYFIIGLILIIANKNQVGKAMLLSSGIILLVGLSTCGIILSGLSIR
ncbi:hypothetical protein [Chitinophaga sp.]|uniref:hypothetical protein n=1 Tax=Chitinophaga sp. TaxID=1869181 RepID=UPI002C8BA494|nr:hypothetical protein [Chitinophaga sp.]HWV64445.1 hypothetical protein [Chitinophaga sp.]